VCFCGVVWLLAVVLVVVFVTSWFARNVSFFRKNCYAPKMVVRFIYASNRAGHLVTQFGDNRQAEKQA
jgi:hypothetical protein